MKLKVILDTNVLISAILFGGKPQKVFNLAITEQVEVYTTTTLLDELRQVLIEKFRFTPEEVNLILKEFLEFVKVVKPTIKLQVIKKDPADNQVLECALEAKADSIVTGDKHLLDLSNFHKTKIINPANFLKLFKSPPT